MYKSYAFMRGGRIYTLNPIHGKDGPLWKCGFRYIGYMDGQRISAFKSKKQFEEFVASEPNEWHNGPHAEATYRAVSMSEWEGRMALNILRENKGKP